MQLGRWMMRLWLACSVVAFAQGARADVAEVVWRALKERRVEVMRPDGSAVVGKLIGIEPTSVAVMEDSGKVVVVPRSLVRTVRGLEAAPPLPRMPSEPPMPPPPVGPPSSRGGTAFDDLKLKIGVTPVVELPGFLTREGRRLLDLEPAYRSALLEDFREPLWRTVVGFALNVMVFPGTGSLFQGDAGWGFPLLAMGAVGIGLTVAGMVQLVGNPFTGGGGGLLVAGVLVWFSSAIIGAVRPWLYQGARYGMLRDFFAHPERYKPRASWTPTFILEPIGLAGQSQQQLVGAGVRAVY